MASSPDQEMMQRLRQIRKEYNKKKRKLKKAHRASEAKAYVRQRLIEEAQEESVCGSKHEHSKVLSIPTGSEIALSEITCDEMHRKSNINPISKPNRDKLSSSSFFDSELVFSVNNVFSTVQDTAENKVSNDIKENIEHENIKENIEHKDNLDSLMKRSCSSIVNVNKLKEKAQAVCMKGNNHNQTDVLKINDNSLKATDKSSPSRLSLTKYRRKHFVTSTPPILARSKTFNTNIQKLAPCIDRSNLISKFQEAQVIVFERQIKSKQKPCSSKDVTEKMPIGEQCSTVPRTGILLSETGDARQQTVRSETGDARQQTVRSETGDARQQTVRSETGDARQQTVRSETGDARQQTVRSETGDARQQTVRSETRDARQQTVRSETGDARQQTVRSETRDARQKTVRSETGDARQQTVRSIMKNHSKRSTPINGSNKMEENSTNPKDFSTECIVSSACVSADIGIENKSTNNKKCDDTHTQEPQSQGRKRRFSGLETQRRSRRISGQPSQESYAQRQGTKVPKMKSKKQVILSSLFQYLVDEAARKNGEIEDFSIPDEYIDSCFKMNALCNGVDFMSDDSNDAKKVVIDNVHDLGETCETEIATLNDKKNVMKENSAELSNEYSASLEIEKGGYQSTESLNEDLDVSDLAEIRAGDNCASMNHSKSENIESPTLFESQSDHETDFSFPFKDKECDYKDIIDRELERELETTFEDTNETGSSALKKSNQLSSDLLSNSVLEIDNKKGQRLVNFENILLPSTNVVRSVLCVEVTTQPSMLVVCLTQSSLKVYGQLDNLWNLMATHHCKVYLKRKSAQVLYSLPRSDKLQFIVMENQSSWLTVSLFTLKAASLHKQVLTSLEGTSCLVCPITEHQMVVGSNSSMGTRLSRLDRQDSALTWETTPLESVHHRVAALVCVRDLPDAVLGITSDALVVIWNVRRGLIISTVDISDVCPSDSLVPAAFYEQGFIMLPMLSGRRGRQAGSVVVINPQLGTSEMLFAIQAQEKTWTGCQISAGILAEDLLIIKETNGILGFWDLHNGSCIATMDDVTVSCLSSSKQYLAVAHRNCVHLFKLM
ncbi:uncharacterized protein LOC127868445 isoform X1 [Dreissena polymorpha]|uniref:uncharacterized protein LOC127868445 isoform X1 n=1 Tax=Dreissena polymorpha TaxID=45954 RepID=UPI0022651A0E|nr:uncharacterized protein LOC127868445 isoform X1 [Dreissena polymorpha]